jgi:hypothetical protein
MVLAQLIVAFEMRAISHIPSMLGRLSKVTDADSHPVRSIGHVAAAISAGDRSNRDARLDQAHGKAR